MVHTPRLKAGTQSVSNNLIDKISIKIKEKKKSACAFRNGPISKTSELCFFTPKFSELDSLEHDEYKISFGMKRTSILTTNSTEKQGKKKYIFFVIHTWSNINHSRALLMGADQYTNKHWLTTELRETL